MAQHSDLHTIFSLPPVGYRQADSISGALGQWSSERSVAIAIPDHTRPLDSIAALQELCGHLHGEVSVVVGLGLHRQMSELELAPLAQFKPIQHNPDDCLPITLPDGEEVGLCRQIVEADFSISLGVAELHQYAGISGGFKGVAVGCASRDFIGALHRRDLVCHSAVRLGQVVGNPFRERIDAVGEASNCLVSLVYVPCVDQWIFGEPKTVIHRASQLINPWRWVSTLAEGAVLRVPPSKASSLYQASRAATYLSQSPHPPLRPGATIILDAKMPEGLGSEQGFVRTLQNLNPPWQSVLSGDEPAGAGAQRVVMLALMASTFRLVLAGCDRPEIFREVGIEAYGGPAMVPKGWIDVRHPFTEIPQWRER